ncbi:MAG: regulatory protein TetR [Actinoallomurus sp.]|nr:regulatory protein TetR [Actinoallomurus sp.]
MAARTESRDRIVRATVQTLATEGYAATTARSVARTGGFAPGVIYYHFDDLEDLLVAAAQYTGESRLARYREELSDVTSATELLERLERLHTEDVADGYMAAVQELTAASSSSPKLAAGIRTQIEPWQNFAEQIAARFVARTPFAALVPIPELARAAIALFLGMEMLSHLDTDGARSDAFFTSAKQAAALFDVMASAPGNLP